MAERPPSTRRSAEALGQQALGALGELLPLLLGLAEELQQLLVAPISASRT